MMGSTVISESEPFQPAPHTEETHEACLIDERIVTSFDK